MVNRFTLVNKSCCTGANEFTFTTDDGTTYNLSKYTGKSDLYLPYRDANKFGGITRLLSDLNNGSKNPDELGWMYGRFYSYKSGLPQGRVKILPVKSIKADSGLLMTRSELIIDNSYASAAAAAIQVPSSANLVVSDLPKSNSGVAKTEEVMEQVMAANVSKGLLSRKKSVEILASPAAQNYADIRQHLTQGEVRNLDADMLAVHSGVEEILEDRKLTGAEEKTKLEALFDKYDLCKYVRTADKVKLTVLELMAKLTSFGQVDKRFRQAKNRSTICYIILSVVLMDPKTFIEKLSGINKGAYSKKQLSH